MIVTPIFTSVVAGSSRRSGWRAQLRDGSKTIWRCSCSIPHRSKERADACGLSELRARLSHREMKVWMATYRPKQEFSQEEMDQMDEDRELVVLETQIALPSWSDPDSLPMTMDEAILAIGRLEGAAIHDARTWDEIRHYQHTLRVIRTLYEKIREDRNRAQAGIMCAEWRGGVELIADEPNEATAGRPSTIGNNSLPITPRPPTLKEKVGSKMYAHRLKELGKHSLDDVRRVCAHLHASNKDATLNAVLEIFRGEDTKRRRNESLFGEPLPNGMDYRQGDCRVALADIPDQSVAAIITDPPYGREADPLYRWLGEFANQKLVPGGSLICYTGQGILPRDFEALGQHLTYWWTSILLHDNAQKLLGAGVRACFKPILWYVNCPVRRVVNERRTLIPDVLNDRRPPEDEDDKLSLRLARSARNKSDHAWAQGDAGVRVWIHHLTRRGDDDAGIDADLIVDPFAGTGTWGRIAADMGRKWIGCDIEYGGTESIAADQAVDAAD
jgi:hypothetical protein